MPIKWNAFMCRLWTINDGVLRKTIRRQAHYVLCVRYKGGVLVTASAVSFAHFDVSGTDTCLVTVTVFPFFSTIYS